MIPAPVEAEKNIKSAMGHDDAYYLLFPVTAYTFNAAVNLARSSFRAEFRQSESLIARAD